MENLYGVQQVEPDIWQLTDVLDDRAYLVVGKRSALLVDSCAGYGNIAETVREITARPVLVALTHSHYDHVGGSYFFERALIAEADDGEGAYERALAEQAYPQLLDRGTFREGVPFGPRDGRSPQFGYVREGDVFDLGGLHVEAVALPAHTPGSIGYIVRERGVLLSGDAVTPIMCLFFPRSLGVEAHVANLHKMERLPIDRFYTGHHAQGFAKSTLEGFEACAEHALTARGVPWQHSLFPQFRGTIYLPDCGTADVDAPNFRALIGPYVERPRRQGGRRRRAS